jgi:hypothetical protein
VDDYNLGMDRIRSDAGVYARENSETEEEFKMLYAKIVSEQAHNWLVKNAKDYGCIYALEDRRK